MTVAEQVEQWWPSLLRQVWGRCPDPESAVQEGLLRCWRAEQRGQVVRRGYAGQAVLSAAIDQRRGRFAQPVSLEAIEHDPHGPEADLTDGPEAERLLARLTPRQRRVILLIAAGYKGEEIAQRMNCTDDAIKKLAQRARASARRLSDQQAC